jgi:hypothetical protein
MIEDDLFPCKMTVTGASESKVTVDRGSDGDMISETRRQMIKRLIDDHEKRVAAEAERYKDKQMDGMPPGVVMLKYPIKTRVRHRADLERQVGFVTGVTMRQYDILYLVTWGDTRGETGHSDFELEEAGDDDGGSNSRASY